MTKKRKEEARARKKEQDVNPFTALFGFLKPSDKKDRKKENHCKEICELSSLLNKKNNERFQPSQTNYKKPKNTKTTPT